MNQLQYQTARASFPRAGIARRELARALSRLVSLENDPSLERDGVDYREPTRDAAWTVARDAQAWLGTLARA